MLTVIEEAGRNKENKRLWKCICECGNEKTVLQNCLKSGHTKSCGCMTKKKFIDLTGQTFGKWKVIEYYGKKPNTKDNNVYWLCECSCDKHTRRLIRDNCLIKGESKSCGCEWYKNFEGYYNNSSHPIHSMSGTRFYRIWGIMRRRCYDKNFDSYPHYGGRGIKVSQEWNEDFLTFKNDMYDKYLKHVQEYGEDNTSIDRIDTDRDYCKENCRWATNEEQANNKRDNHYIEYKGKVQSVTMWCKELSLDYTTVIQRINKGWNIEEAFFKEKPQQKEITYNGETKSLHKWCIDLNVDYDNIRHRMNKMGMTFEEAINKPTGRWVS